MTFGTDGLSDLLSGGGDFFPQARREKINTMNTTNIFFILFESLP
jgi:hypothetical protein